MLHALCQHDTLVDVCYLYYTCYYCTANRAIQRHGQSTDAAKTHSYAVQSLEQQHEQPSAVHSKQHSKRRHSASAADGVSAVISDDSITNSSISVTQYDTTAVRLQAAVALYTSSSNSSSGAATNCVNNTAQSSVQHHDAAVNGNSSTATAKVQLSISSSHSKHSSKTHLRNHHKSKGAYVTDVNSASTELHGEYDAIWHEERLAHLQASTVIRVVNHAV
jgi:hypothetical protein